MTVGWQCPICGTQFIYPRPQGLGMAKANHRRGKCHEKPFDSSRTVYGVGTQNRSNQDWAKIQRRIARQEKARESK